MRGENEAHKSVAHRTVLSSLIDSDLPTPEKSLIRLQQEAAGIVGAGIETTKTTLSLATFHILDNPQILGRLQQELRTAFLDASKPPSLSVLEKLPYLTAVLLEGEFIVIPIVRCIFAIYRRLNRKAPIPGSENPQSSPLEINLPFCRP